MDSEAGGPGRSGGEGGTGSNESRHSWCVGRTRVKGCDVLWLRLAHPVLLLDSQGKPSASLGLNSPASAATVSDSAPNSRWVFLTRDWLFFSRAPFKGQLFEARVPVTALQVICTSLSSITQGRGLVVAAAEEWWARAAPPPSSNDGSYAGAAATAAMARDASVALRTFRSSGLRSTKPALVSGCGVPAAAVIGCERREQRRCDRRRTHRTEQSRAYLIGCRSVEERNWLLYCLQAAASSPPPLGFLRTLSALAEAELLLQQIALFLVTRGCLTLGSQVELEFAGLALGISSSSCSCCSSGNSNCNSNGGCGGSNEGAADCLSSLQEGENLPCRYLAGLGSPAAAAAAAEGGWRLAASIPEFLLQQPHHAVHNLLMLLGGDDVRYLFSNEMKEKLRHRVERLETVQGVLRDQEQQLHQRLASASAAPGSGRGGPGSPRSLHSLASYGGVVLETLHRTLRKTWALTAGRLRLLGVSCCCDSETRCGGCRCCSSSRGAQQQKLLYTKHGPLHMPNGVYRQFKRLLEVAGPLQAEMEMQQAKKRDMMCRRGCCSCSSSCSSSSSSNGSDCSWVDRRSSWSGGWNGSCLSGSPETRLKMMPRYVHPFFSQLMRVPYECLRLQQVVYQWAEAAAKLCRAAPALSVGGLVAQEDYQGESVVSLRDVDEGDREALTVRQYPEYPGHGRRRLSGSLDLQQPKLPRVGEDCVICLEPFSPEALMTRYPGCCHAYHLSCLGTWIDWQNKSRSPSTVFFRPTLSPTDHQQILSRVAAVLLAEDEAACRSASCSHCQSCSAETSWQQQQQLLLRQQQHPNHHHQAPSRAGNDCFTMDGRETASWRHSGCRSLAPLPTAATESNPAAPAVPAAAVPAAAASIHAPAVCLAFFPTVDEGSVASCAHFGELQEASDGPGPVFASSEAAGPVSQTVPPEQSGASVYTRSEDAAASAAATAGSAAAAGSATAADGQRETPRAVGAAAAGIEGCYTWRQLLLQMTDIEFWMMTEATGPQLAAALRLLEARGLPLSSVRSSRSFRSLKVFRDRCPMCQHTTSNPG